MSYISIMKFIFPDSRLNVLFFLTESAGLNVATVKLLDRVSQLWLNFLSLLAATGRISAFFLTPTCLCSPGGELLHISGNVPHAFPSFSECDP